MEPNDQLPSFSLRATDGRTYTEHDFDRPLLLVVFTCNHCPYAQAYDGRLKSLAEDYAGKLDTVFVNSNDAKAFPEDGFEKMVMHAKAKGFSFPYLHDPRQSAARVFGAKVTPHSFLFDNERKLVYNGAIDDNWREPELAMDRYLHDAVERTLMGEPPAKPFVEPVGCTVKWL